MSLFLAKKGFILLIGFGQHTESVRNKRQAFLLANGADTFLKTPLSTQFRCVKTGYFADIDNNCQMYHVCVVQPESNGKSIIRQYSFVCGNGTIFNQLTLTCGDPEESLPCEDAPKYYKLNNKIGERNTWIHNGNDWEEGFESEDATSDNLNNDNDRFRDEDDGFGERDDYLGSPAERSAVVVETDGSNPVNEPGFYVLRRSRLGSYGFVN